MKNSIHFKALDDSFDFDTSLTDAQKNYIIKIFTENSEVNGSDVTEVAIIIYKKHSHEYIRYSGSVSDGWYKSSYSNSFDNWSAVTNGDTEIDQGEMYILYSITDIYNIPTYDNDGNVTVNSRYKLRNFHPSNAILLDELNEIKNDINFKALDDSFNFDTSLTDAQKNYLKQILMENTEPNASGWSGPYIINYKQNSYSTKVIGSDGNFFTISGHPNYPIDGIDNFYIRTRTEINSAQHYLLYKIPDIYTIYEYDGDGNVNGNTLYRLRNFQPSNATLQAEINEMKNSIYFKELDDDFNFDTSLSGNQKNYIKQILSENMEPSGTVGAGGPFLII